MTPLPYDLAELRCFVVLGETLHFGHAAARLNMTQPPLSRRIALLEQKLGVQLFKRGRRSVNITPAGRYLLHEAKLILKRVEDSAVEARLAAEGTLGTLTIGFTASVGYVLLPNLIALHHKRYPGTSFACKELLIDEQLRQLDSGALDVAIIRPPVDAERFHSRILMQDRWALALPCGHALTRRRTVPLDALHEQSYIAWSPAAAYAHLSLEGVFQAAGVRPRTVASVSLPPAILSMVRAGLGLALVPSAMAGLGVPGVVLRPLDPARIDPMILALDSVMAWRRDNVSAMVERMIETASEFEVTKFMLAPEKAGRRTGPGASPSGAPTAPPTRDAER